AGDDGTVRIWDPVAGVAVGDPLTGHTAGVWALASWTDGNGACRLASAGDDGNVRVWDPVAGRQISQAPHPGRVMALTALRRADGSVQIASAGNEGAIRLWDPDTGTRIGEPLLTHSGWVLALTALPGPGDGPLLAAANYDRTIVLWDLDTGRPVGSPMTGHTAGVTALTYWTAPDGTARLASASDDGTIRSWDPGTGRTAGAPLRGHNAGILSLAAWTEPDGTARLASASSDGAVRVWDPETSRMQGPPLVGHTGWLRSVITVAGPDGTTRLVSGSYDGSIRVWDLAARTSLAAAGDGHPGGVLSLASWTGPDGPRVASGGYDGSIRVWDPDTGQPAAAAPMTGHSGGVLAMAVWYGPAGAPRLATVGYDGSVRIWDPNRGEQVGEVLPPQPDRLWAVTCWTPPDGRTRLAAVGDEGTVRIWDADTATPLEIRLPGHHGGGRALASWVGPEGARVAVASGDGAVVVWDPDTAAQVCPPLTGHTLWVWTLVTWETSRGRRLLASASYDATIRLWDPERGLAIRSVEVGAITLWGLTDAPAQRDLLGREALVDSLVRQIYRADDAQPAGQGPVVVTVEGPWGCGKSTLMQLVRSRLPTVTDDPSAADTPRSQLTVRQAMRVIRQSRRATTTPQPPAASRGVVTAWFDPWSHQSGGQVWAGLTEAIIDAAAPVLYPTELARTRYWFARNVRKVDRYALLLSIRRRIISPALGVWLIALVAQVGVALLGEDHGFYLMGRQISGAAVALTVSTLVALIGIGHTTVRYFWAPVSAYIGTALFRGPLSPGAAIQGSGDGRQAAADPLYEATAGSLYLQQHDIHELLTDLRAHGYGLVVFVDDLDRCRSDTTAQVFQAINLFLSGLTADGGMHGCFVLGLDPVVVASHVDRELESPGAVAAAPHGDDPSVGWAYLRKLVQLPVRVPEVGDDGLRRFVEAATRAPTNPAPPDPGPAPQPSPSPTPAASPPAARSGATASSTTATHTGVPGPRRTDRPRRPVEVTSWRNLEQHPRVLALLRHRLSAQPERSIREAKRLLNVWQLYARVLDTVEPLSGTEAMITRARHLVLLAEIITRWPALQASLHQRFDGRRGLDLLVDALDDPLRWDTAAVRIGLDVREHDRALSGLRQLLRDNDAPEVAALARRLL
ncbi:P-loop NTPase fold protein, partial [Streptomyces sp. NPDC054804]